MVEALLLGVVPASSERDVDEHELVAALDIKVVPIKSQRPGAVQRDDLKAIPFGHAQTLDQRLMDGV